MAAASGPPSPCTILIQMGCPLKGTAVSRLRECHCRFLLPGGPHRLPARPWRPSRPGVGSPGTPQPLGGTAGPAGEQKGASWASEPAAPRSPGSRHGTAGTRLPPLAARRAGQHGGMGARCSGNQLAQLCRGPRHRFLPHLGMPHGGGTSTVRLQGGTRRASAPPGTRPGTATMLPAGHVRPSRATQPSPPPQLPGQSPAHASPRKCTTGVGGPSPSLPRDASAPSLCATSCRLPAPNLCPGAVPCAKSCAVPRGCAAPQGSPPA